jgi:hypothetical protein
MPDRLYACRLVEMLQHQPSYRLSALHRSPDSLAPFALVYTIDPRSEHLDQNGRTVAELQADIRGRCASVTLHGKREGGTL